MPSSLPLNNALAQNSVDFNTQIPTNSSGLFRYKVNTRGNNYTFTSTDFNSVCIFSLGVGGVTTVFLNAFGVAPPVGTEIIFYSTIGLVNIQGNATLYVTVGRVSSTSAGKIIHRGNNVWYFASLNTTKNQFNWTNCCSNFESLYQVGEQTNFDPNKFSYTDAALNTPFNGIVYYDNDGLATYNKVVNGVATGSGSCTTVTFNIAYTYYTNTDPENPETVDIYSVEGLTRTSPPTLLGNSFFTEVVTEQQECYTSNRVTGVTYYINAGGGASITFLNGYVVSYTS